MLKSKNVNNYQKYQKDGKKHPKKCQKSGKNTQKKVVTSSRYKNTPKNGTFTDVGNSHIGKSNIGKCGVGKNKLYIF
jgi:hypothetical protein